MTEQIHPLQLSCRAGEENHHLKTKQNKQKKPHNMKKLQKSQKDTQNYKNPSLFLLLLAFQTFILIKKKSSQGTQSSLDNDF